MDEKFYERMYQANVKLSDENTLLKDYTKDLEKRIEKATEMLDELINLYNDNYTISDKAKDIQDTLKSEY